MLTFFRKQPFQIGLSFRSGGEIARPRVSTPTGRVYCVCIARRRVRGREASSPIGSARSRTIGCRISGCGRRCRPMLWRYVRVVRPCCAVSGDCSGRVGIRRVSSGCLGVCCWGVSVRIGARLTRVVVRHGVRLVTCVARSTLPHARTPSTVAPTTESFTLLVRRAKKKEPKSRIKNQIRQNLFDKTRYLAARQTYSRDAMIDDSASDRFSLELSCGAVRRLPVWALWSSPYRGLAVS